MNKLLFYLLFFFFLSSSLYAQKDSIKLASGQILLGKIKSMEKSILLFSTPFSDSDFKIKWGKVIEVYSQQDFIISLSDGKRFHSSINTDTINKKQIILIDEGEKIVSNLNKIVFLDPFLENFFKRISAAFDVGLTLTKANNSKQASGNANVTYTSFKWNFLTSFNLVFSKQDNIDDVRRYEGHLSAQRFLPKEWFTNVGVDFLSNTEQKLKLRTTSRFGGGYFIKRNNSLYFGVGAGLGYNIETYTTTDTSLESQNKNSLESYFAAEFNKYNIGDLSILSTIVLSPSITEKGRVRADIKFDLKYDLTGSIYLKTGLIYNFDNQPIEGATKGDYVFQTTVGWDIN